MTAPLPITPPLLDLQNCNLAPLTGDAAVVLICQCGATERLYHSRLLRNRMLLGATLLTVQDRELWREMGCRSWMDFLKREFPRLSGLEVRTAYDAMDLATSKTLQAMSPAELDAIPHLAHARLIAKRDRHGDPMTPEQIAEANGKGVVELTADSGVAKVWSADGEKTRQLQRVMDALAPASAAALQWLADLLESDAAKAYAGGSPNLPDFLLGIMVTCALDELRATYVNLCEELGPERVLVLARHGWACVACGRFLPLQAHHIEFRSHGGGDEPENLEPRCQGCHEKVHGR